jgi:hypothetical protein
MYSARKIPLLEIYSHVLLRHATKSTPMRHASYSFFFQIVKAVRLKRVRLAKSYGEPYPHHFNPTPKTHLLLTTTETWTHSTKL